MHKSYAATRIGLLARFGEARALYRMQSRNLGFQVEKLLRRVRRIEEQIVQTSGRPLQDQDFLEIGPGQRLKYLKYFGTRNRAVGIDLDVIPVTLSWRELRRLLRVNGTVRTCKTLARKTLGLDARFDRELARQMGVQKLGQPQLLQMNAENLTFADDSFDVVFSSSTFEHLTNPGRVLEQVKRVLRPGGVAYLALHLYTSETGSHDARLIASRRDLLPAWAHLRPEHQDKVHPNSYVNGVRLAEWLELYRQHLPGVSLELVPDEHPQVPEKLRALRAAGELSEYSDEELTTIEILAVWKKPVTQHEATIVDAVKPGQADNEKLARG